jgi:predicted Zn-dependent protease
MKMLRRKTLILASALAMTFGFGVASAQQQGFEYKPPPPMPPDSFNEMQQLMTGQGKRGGSGYMSRLSPAEKRAIRPLEAALEDKDYEGAKAALSGAQAGAKGSFAKFLVSALQLQLGQATADLAMQSQAIDGALLSGQVPKDTLSSLYRTQGELSIEAKDYPKAETAFGKLVEASPNDPDVIVLLAETKNRAGKPAEALPLLMQAISMKEAAKQQVPEAWFRVAQQLRGRISSPN